MLANGKVKCPSFRIDDILNNNFGNRSLPTELRSNDDDLQTDFESNGEHRAKTNSEDESTDQPINLSFMGYPKKSETLLNLPFNLLQTNENYSGESQFKNLKSISSISSSSPTLSVGSSDSPSFQNQPVSPTSSTVDQLIGKCNQANDALKGHFPTNFLSLSLCPQETESTSYPTNSQPDASPSFFIGPQYSRSAIEEFYFKLNKKQPDDNEPNRFESTTFDKPVDSLITEEVSLHNISDALKKFQQHYQAQQFAKNSSLLNQLPTYSTATVAPNHSPSSLQLNQPNSSFYMQQFYIRMKMAMQSKPRKGGQIRFNHQQTNELETMFSVKSYLIPSERRAIAKKLSLSERQVKTWFQNRRAKQRRSKF